MSKIIFDLDNDVAATSGMRKHITVYEDRVVLKAKGMMMTNGWQGEKTIFYSDCTGVQIRMGGALTAGYLQIETSSGSGMTDRTNPYQSENSVAFRKSQNDVMDKIAKYIKEQMRNQKNKSAATITTALSPAEELKKFKELLDMGIITQEEFDAKKKQLLNL